MKNKKYMAKGKINLHCHSTYSDGANTLEELAIAHKKQGFDALVITDHFFPSAPCVYLNKDSFNNQTKEALKLSKKLDYSIIQGVELALYSEEILIFGRKIILKIFDYFEANKKLFVGDFTPEHCYKIFTIFLEFISQYKNECAIILPHPKLYFIYNKNSSKEEGVFYKKLLEVVDGYERFNMGTDYFKNRTLPKELKNKKVLINSDAHYLDCISKGNNQTNKKITTEEDVIAYIKSSVYL